jgi:hypothetical protein
MSSTNRVIVALLVIVSLAGGVVGQDTQPPWAPETEDSLRTFVDRYNGAIGDTTPGPTAGLIRNERVTLLVTDTDETTAVFSFRTDADLEIHEFRAGARDDTTIRMYTDRATVARIAKASDRPAAFEAAVRAGDIRIEGVGLVNGLLWGLVGVVLWALRSPVEASVIALIGFGVLALAGAKVLGSGTVAAGSGGAVDSGSIAGSGGTAGSSGAVGSGGSTGDGVTVDPAGAELHGYDSGSADFHVHETADVMAPAESATSAGTSGTEGTTGAEGTSAGTEGTAGRAEVGHTTGPAETGTTDAGTGTPDVAETGVDVSDTAGDLLDAVDGAVDTVDETLDSADGVLSATEEHFGRVDRAISSVERLFILGATAKAFKTRLGKLRDRFLRLLGLEPAVDAADAEADHGDDAGDGADSPAETGAATGTTTGAESSATERSLSRHRRRRRPTPRRHRR